MASVSYDPRLTQLIQLQNQTTTNNNSSSMIRDEIEGLLRVYKDGRVQRFPVVPNVPCTSSEAGVASTDAVVDKFSNLWCRIYVPTSSSSSSSNSGDHKLPVVVYFHGGGFCVGSAAWSCYHSFLSRLAAKARCVIFSVNYRLAPEHRLPAAYDDGLKALSWLLSEENRPCQWWRRRCNLGSGGVYLAGDSAGANIAYNVASSITSSSNRLNNKVKGLILIQPFFGGEARTPSEKNTATTLPLTLSASDAYWRLSLPFGANRDHPFCNPLAAGLQLRAMVCVSEMDILRDRNLELCNAMRKSAGSYKVEMLLYGGVGHAFHILDHSSVAQIRLQEMISHIKTFVHQSL
ncbi:Probable carboxylesterase 17 [Linum grandiflorum]